MVKSDTYKRAKSAKRVKKSGAKKDPNKAAEKKTETVQI